MLHRATMLSLVVVFLAVSAASALACDGMRGRMSCCCTPATGTVLRAAMECCEISCSPRAPENAPVTPAQASSDTNAGPAPSVAERAPAPAAPFADLLGVSLKSIEARAAAHTPPDLFVQHSAFLI